MSKPHDWHRQIGLSLVELMIALLLGSLLTLGATQVFLSSNTTYNLTDGIARVQENARFASSFLGDQVRKAGSQGCLFGPNPANQVQDIRINPLPPNLSGLGVVGWEANNTAPGDTLQLPAGDNLPLAGANTWNSGGTPPAALPPSVAGNMAAGTDAFLVEGAFIHDLNGNTVTNVGGTSINLSGDPGIPQGTVLQVISSNCTTAIRFQRGNSQTATSIVAGGTFNQQGNNVPSITAPPMDTNLSIAVYQSSLFYIGNGVNGPALFRQSLEGPTPLPPPAEILGGVENMQLLYATLDATNNINNYVTADNITNWANVASVRITLLMRSDNNARSEQQQRPFNLLGLAVTTPNDRRVRLKTTNTVAIRNRLQ